MKTCILTVIKDEHEYLDEWIQYHLNLGINHIFIFEDAYSKSHKEITDKYEYVSLDSIVSILKDDEIHDIIELKKGWRKIRQITYIKRGLEYVKQNHPSYDWCFAIDNDEFITLEDNDKTLEDVLQIYNGYDAFLMQWMCFGSNGNIKKPDYSKKGVVDTYTKSTAGIKFRNLLWDVKTCYNMNVFSEKTFDNCHYPNMDCNWCKTDLSKDRQSQTYDNIYIRHYITKSWEEYVWKKTCRGYFFGFSRTYDFYFSVNPELKDRKRELISLIGRDFSLSDERCTLVVMPYVQNKSQGKEIEITLNGWRKFCKFNYHFVVIGEFATSLIEKYPWVDFILKKQIDIKEDQYTPHLDIINKFDFVANKYKNIYDGFIYTCDDYYPIKPFDLSDIMTTYYLSSNFTGNERASKTYWNHDKWKTRQLLDKENLPHINYTTHYPYYMEFSKLKEIIDKYDLLNESYVFDDIYFNYFKHDEPIQVDKYV